jgi:hypothetical protein
MHGQRNIKIYKIYVLSFFFYENHAVYEIMWKHIVELEKPQMKTRHMRIAWWITKATYVHTECAIIIDFPMHKWLHEHAPILRCIYMAYLGYH